MSSSKITAEELATSNSEPLARLRKHFDVPIEQHGTGWDKLWESGTFLPWDRGLPNPALVDVMKERKDLVGEAVSDGNRKRALIPGCGKGYDTLLLASLGYDAYGLEISPNALDACSKFAAENFPSYEANAHNPNGSGQYKFILGDFFKDDWMDPTLAQQGFDIIYDYTFLCALPVALRPKWASRMSKLLAKDGRLICVEFPTKKDPATGGPPFGLVPETYLAHLNNPGKDISYSDSGYAEERWTHERSGPALERVDHWMPERTHEIGKGADWISVWRHQ